MTCVRWFVVSSLAAEAPAEQTWCSIDDATIASTGDLARVVLAEAKRPSTTALWLQTNGGWKKISSLARVPSGDLVVKAVVGRPGGHALCTGGTTPATLQQVNLFNTRNTKSTADVLQQVLTDCHGRKGM